MTGGATRLSVRDCLVKGTAKYVRFPKQRQHLQDQGFQRNLNLPLFHNLPQVVRAEQVTNRSGIDLSMLAGGYSAANAI